MKGIIRFFGPLASLLGWMLIAIAVFGPFTQLKEFEFTLLKIIKYIVFGVGENIWEKFGYLFGFLLNPIIFGALGVALIAFGRRAWIMNEWKKILRDESELPVIYLRAFHSDDIMSRRGTLRFSVQSEEEQLVESLKEIGPVYAIGKPGEMLPLLGAARVYIEDAVWQEEVKRWFQKATLVVVRLSPFPSAGVQWELETCLNVVLRERLVFLIPKGVDQLDWFNEILLKQSLPTFSGPTVLNKVYGSANSGIAYFNEDGILEFEPLRKPPLFRRPFSSPLVVVYRQAFRPIISRINKTWTALPWAFGEVVFKTFVTLFFLLPIVFFAHMTMNDMTPFEKESMKMSGRLSRYHPEIDPANIEKYMKFDNIGGILRRMSDGELWSWLALQQRILHAATQQECTAILDGTIQSQGNAMEDLLNRIAESDAVFMHSWFVFLEKLIVEASRTQKPSTSDASGAESQATAGEDNANEFGGMSEAEYDQLSEEFFNGMSPEIRNRYQSDQADADNCWVARTNYGRLIEMGDIKGSKLARAYLLQ
jgi:hypothetical protein